jgi:3alpha(or 20beta)-hydroxysteroid dehydrogenase
MAPSPIPCDCLGDRRDTWMGTISFNELSLHAFAVHAMTAGHQSSLDSRRRFEGSTVVVTGAASGLGAACVERFIDEGAVVHSVDLAPSDAAHQTHLMDVTDEAAWGELASRVGPQGVDVVVTAAGIIHIGNVSNTSADDLRRVLNVNLVGTFLALKHLAPAMSAGSSAILIASTSGLRGTPNTTAYSASKWAVRGLARVAAVELAELGVRVVCVCPGASATPMAWRAYRDDDDLVAHWGSRLLVPRMAWPEEIAGVVAFAASSEAGYITGTDIVIDGGIGAR